LHFTPTSASWLNLVERWFGLLTEKQIRRGVHRGTRQLEDAIRRYLAIYNEDPKPFVWTKTADEILLNLKTFASFEFRVGNGACQCGLEAGGQGRAAGLSQPGEAHP